MNPTIDGLGEEVVAAGDIVTLAGSATVWRRHPLRGPSSDAPVVRADVGCAICLIVVARCTYVLVLWPRSGLGWTARRFLTRQ